MEVVEDLFVCLGSGAGSDFRPRRIVPVAWHTDCLDFGRLGPLLDLTGDELWLGFAPDTCGDFGLGDGLEVRTCLDWSDSSGEREIQDSVRTKDMDGALLV